MKNESSPALTPEMAALNQRVAAGVRSHQRKIRALTGAAFILGFLAVAASVLIVAAYFILYRPKEIEVLHQVNLVAAAKANPATMEGGAPPQLPFDFPHIQAQMSFFHSVVLMSLAIAIGLLALGTLVLVAVVILNRRATLHQVNTSLAQISEQLKQLQVKPGC